VEGANIAYAPLRIRLLVQTKNTTKIIWSRKHNKVRQQLKQASINFEAINEIKPQVIIRACCSVDFIYYIIS
jgi:hypothetical protein